MTRTCPSCQTSYPDEVFFCGHDGAITVQEQDPEDFDPRLGRQLGGYVAVARVADGAMGRVFEGRHPETKARVAIKVLHSHVARDRVAVERFKREYDAALEMAHPNIVKVLEFGATPDNSYFMTMEYLEGLELSRTFGGRKLAPARIVRTVCQTALALDYAHSFGFIHRDLKPDNVFLCRTDDGDAVRLLDFGSVKLQMDDGAKLTAIGTTVGSPFYMSPEQAMGKSDVDGRTDVFALGAILYEMLTGKIAFEAPSVAMILMKILNESPPPPTTLDSSCPPRMDDVVDKALRKEKTERYGTAAQLAQGMLEAFGLEGGVEEWARRPQADVARALESATLPPARPFGASAPPPAVPSPGAMSHGRATAPSLISSVPGVARGGLGVGMIAAIGLALLLVGGLIVMSLR